MLFVIELHRSPLSITVISSQIFISVVLFLTVSSAAESNKCNRSCGKAENRVPYPFGFSNGCEIMLNCSENNGNIHVGDFLVQNLTWDHILLSVPGECNRSIKSLKPVFGSNFALTGRNLLLLQNCSPPVNDFTIPSNSGNYNQRISYYAEANDTHVEFLNYEKIRGRVDCSLLFSSVIVDWNQNSNNTSSNLSLELLQVRNVELGWWIPGNCDCDPNAECTPVNGKGFRCKCRTGYAGDGFTRGEGCKTGNDADGEKSGQDEERFILSTMDFSLVLHLVLFLDFGEYVEL